MSLRNSKSTPSVDFSDLGILPLINVVFLLLMFFMIAGTISSQDRSLELPTSSSEEAQARNGIQLEIIESGVVLLNGENIATEIHTQLQQAFRSSESTEQQGLVVRISKDLEVGALDDVLIAIRDLNIKTVQIATQARP